MLQVKAPGSEAMLARAVESYQRAYSVLITLWDKRHPDVDAVYALVDRARAMLEQSR